MKKEKHGLNIGLYLEVVTSAVLVIKLVVPTRNTRFLPNLTDSRLPSRAHEEHIAPSTLQTCKKALLPAQYTVFRGIHPHQLSLSRLGKIVSEKHHLYTAPRVLWMVVVSQSSVKFGKKRVFLIGTINFIGLYCANCGNSVSVATDSFQIRTHTTIIMICPHCTHATIPLPLCTVPSDIRLTMQILWQPS